MGILRKRFLGTKIFRLAISYALISAVAILSFLPLCWLFVSSFKIAKEIVRIPPTFFPENPTIRTYRYLFKEMRFGRYFINTLIVAGGITFLIIITSSLGGYVFAKFDFRFKEFIFVFLISTMMIPFVTIMLPLYVMISDFGWVNRFEGLIVPMCLSAFGMFLMRQFIENIPTSLIEAARMDGASEWWIYFRVILPLALPAVSALGIFSFMWSWNNLLWPLLVISKKDMYTVTLAIAALQWEAGIRYDVVVTGTALSVLPVMAVYAFASKAFIRGLSFTGLKY
jgi:ABC-type glycerol-3-phosphate transport system permease component